MPDAVTERPVRPPATLPVRPEAIPAELKALPRWVAWRWEWRDLKWTKPPINPHTGALASPTDPATWGTFEEAQAHARTHELPGVGFVLGGSGYTGVDLDHCRAKTGVIEEWAREIVHELPAYWEISPSGTGLRGLVRARKPAGRCRKDGIEIYDTGRYVTVTGHRLPESAEGIPKSQAALDALHARLFPPEPARVPVAASPVTLDDRELLEKAFAAKNGDSVRRLWNGDISRYGDDQSRADEALASHLYFWTRGDSARMERLFSQSALGQRDKWQDRPDYRQRTIQSVLQRGGDVYSPGTNGHGSTPTTDEPPAAWSPAVLLTPDEIKLAQASESWVSRFIRYARSRTDAPLEFHEATAYALLSGVVGRKARLRLTTGDLIVTLWVMLTADSTVARKSTALDINEDVAITAGLDLMAPDDFTPQRFVNFMAERDGRECLFRRDEFSGFYAGLNRLEHQTGTKQILIAFYDGRAYRRELVGDKVKADDGSVKRKPEVVEVKAPFLSIMAGIQRELLLETANHADIAGGFLPRFSFIEPAARTEHREVGVIDTGTLRERDMLAADLRRIANAPPREMKVAAGVLPRWNAYTRALENEAQGAPIPSIAGPVFDRHGRVALKIAVILAGCEGDTVHMKHLVSGIEVAERWRRNSYNLLAAIGPSREEKRVQKVLDLIRRKPGIKRSEVMSALRVLAREMDGFEETLLGREWIVIEPTARGKSYRALDGAGFATFEGLSRPYIHAGVPSLRPDINQIQKEHLIKPSNPSNPNPSPTVDETASRPATTVEAAAATPHGEEEDVAL